MPTLQSQPNSEGPTFRIFSGALKALPDNPNRIHCTASSSVDDLHGDIMEPECVSDMADQALSKNMLIFLNHEYKIPEDVFGQTVHAVAGVREGFMDLDLDVDAVTSNKDAVDTLNLINVDKVTLGVSIGCMVEDWAYKDEAKGFEGGLRIKKVKLLEASVVGIPANQRSWTRGNRNWVRQAAMAVKSFEAAKSETGMLVIGDESRELAIQALSLGEEQDAENNVAADDGESNIGTPDIELMPTEDPAPQPVESQPAYIPPAEDPAPHPVPDEPGHGTNKSDVPDDLDEEPVLTEAGGCPDCGKGRGMGGDCSNAYHKSEEPQVTLSHSELPDSAFACIESGGKKDASGKTTPRSLRHYPHHTASGEINKALLRNAISRIGDKSNIQCGKSHLLSHARDAGIGEKTADGWEVMVGDDVLVIRDYTAKQNHEPETYEADGPYQGCGCTDETPEVGEDAPESGMTTSDVALTASAEDVLVTSLSEAVIEIKTLRTANAALKADNETLNKALAQAAMVVEKLARMPLGRRTSAAPVISDFRRTWSGIYPEAWLKFIEEKDKEP